MKTNYKNVFFNALPGLLTVAGLTANAQLPEPMIFSNSYDDHKQNSFNCDLHANYSREKFLECLQDYANETLQKNTNIQLHSGYNSQQLLEQKLSLVAFDKKLDRNDITPLDLANVFRYEIPRNMDTAQKGQCFAEKFESIRHEKDELKNFQSNFKNQINELNQFLIEFHASSFGQVRSFLFQVESIRLCDLESYMDRAIFQKNGALRIGLDTSDFEEEDPELLKVDEILKNWNSGSAIRHLEANHWMGGFWWNTTLAGAYLKKNRFEDHKEAGSPIGIIYDLFAKYWMALNPMGDARKSARLAIKKLYTAFERDLRQSDSFYCSNDQCEYDLHARRIDKLKDYMSGPGFSNEQHQHILDLEEATHTNMEITRSIFKSWKIKILNPLNLVRSMESSLLNSPGSNSSPSSITVMDRIFKCGVAVGNNHTINIAINNLFSISSFPPLSSFNSKEEVIKKSDIYTEFERKGVKLKTTSTMHYNENTDETYAGVCVNTSDIINISINIPKVDKDSIKRLNLYLALEESLNQIDKRLY